MPPPFIIKLGFVYLKKIESSIQTEILFPQKDVYPHLFFQSFFSWAYFLFFSASCHFL